MKTFVNFNDLRKATSEERESFFKNAKVKDLHTIFNNEGYKRYSHFSKVDKIQAIKILMKKPNAKVTFKINNYETETIVRIAQPKTVKAQPKAKTPENKFKTFNKNYYKDENGSQSKYFHQFNSIESAKSEFNELYTFYQNKFRETINMKYFRKMIKLEKAFNIYYTERFTKAV